MTGDLPSGVTLRGNYAVRIPDGTVTGDPWAQISFNLRLPSDPTVNVVPDGGPKPAACQGTVYMPEAAPGNLCIYRQFENGLGAPAVFEMASAGSPDNNVASGGAAGRTGAFLDFVPSGTTVHLARGSWAVTAPWRRCPQGFVVSSRRRLYEPKLPVHAQAAPMKARLTTR